MGNKKNKTDLAPEGIVKLLRNTEPEEPMLEIKDLPTGWKLSPIEMTAVLKKLVTLLSRLEDELVGVKNEFDRAVDTMSSRDEEGELVKAADRGDQLENEVNFLKDKLIAELQKLGISHPLSSVEFLRGWKIAINPPCRVAALATRPKTSMLELTDADANLWGLREEKKWTARIWDPSIP